MSKRTWSCAVCTLENAPETDVCIVCEAPKPAGDFSTPRENWGRTGLPGEESYTSVGSGAPPLESQRSRTSTYYATDSSNGDFSSGVSDSDSSTGECDTARSSASTSKELSGSFASLEVSPKHASSSSRRSKPKEPKPAPSSAPMADMPEFSEQEVTEAFAAFDSDGDGFLSQADVALFFAALGQDLTATQVKNLVNEVDRDRDGKVSFKEFIDLANNSTYLLQRHAK